MSEDAKQTLSALGGLIGIVAAAIGLLATIWAGTRGVRIIVRFALFEIQDELLFLSIVVGGSLGWLFLPSLLNRGGRRFALAAMVTRQVFAKKWLRIGPVALMATALFTGYLPVVRYRYFADIYFARQVREAIAERNMIRARSFCYEYISLYPRKGPRGGSKDFACGMILSRAANLGPLAPYVLNYKLGTLPQYVDGVRLPDGVQTRDRARQLLTPWLPSTGTK